MVRLCTEIRAKSERTTDCNNKINSNPNKKVNEISKKERMQLLKILKKCKMKKEIYLIDKNI